MGIYSQPQNSPPPTPSLNQWLAERPQLPYLLPFLIFVGLGFLPPLLGNFAGIDWKKVWFDYYGIVYFGKTIAGAFLLWLCWKSYTPIKWSKLPLGVLVGLFGVVLWVGLEYLSQKIGYSKDYSLSTDPYDVHYPLKEITNPTYLILFFIIRVTGPTLVVPIMEELFFRDFIMRFLYRGARFQDVAVATFDRRNGLSWFSLIGMSVLFAVNHIQQPSGFAYGLLMGILLLRTKSLGSCIVAHGTTNLVLYLWVIYAGTQGNHWVWQFM